MVAAQCGSCRVAGPAASPTTSALTPPALGPRLQVLAAVHCQHACCLHWGARTSLPAVCAHLSIGGAIVSLLLSRPLQNLDTHQQPLCQLRVHGQQQHRFCHWPAGDAAQWCKP